MKRRVGKCPLCGERTSVTQSPRYKAADGKERSFRDEIGEVVDDYVIAWHTSPVTMRRCDGNYMQPELEPADEKRRARAIAKRDAALLARLDAFRLHAAVALDAFEGSYPYPRADLRILLRVSAFEYRRHFPDSNALAPLRYVPLRNWQHMPMKTGDCYCTFCGELVLRGIKNKRFGKLLADDLLAMSMRTPHAIRCALTHLTHGHKPAPPSARRLPGEYLEQPEADA